MGAEGKEVSEELMPCPFCGGEARLDQRTTQSLWNSSDAVFSHVACDECDISGQDFCDDPDGEEAIEWWNRRAQPAEAEGVELTGEYHADCNRLIAALSAVTAERDALAARLGEWERSTLARIMRENVELTAERDRLLVDLERAHRATNSECMDWAREYERRKEVQAERDQLRAEVERYVPLHEAVQRAAGELPEGWAIQLYIERDGGGVELIGPDGTEDFATNNERLDYTVIDALEAAMAAKEA